MKRYSSSIIAAVLSFSALWTGCSGESEAPPDDAEAKLEQIIVEGQEGNGADSLAADSTGSLADQKAGTDPAPGEVAGQGAGAPMTFNPKGRYLIQVGAFKGRPKAEKVTEDLRKMGFPAQTLSAGGLYRVRIGFFGTSDDAKAAGERLKREVGLDYWVVGR